MKVTDAGTGMAREELEKNLDPFYTTKRESGGTGLGLSVSYNIVQKHNAKMDFSSKLGKGTVVTIIIPAFLKDKDG